MTTTEVEDFGFADSPTLYSHIRPPGAIIDGNSRPSNVQVIDDDQGFFSTGLGDAPLDMFKVEHAQLNLNITILQVVVSNNILVMASTDSKIYKIDLTLQEQIVGISLLCLMVDGRNGTPEETWRNKENQQNISRLSRRPSFGEHRSRRNFLFQCSQYPHWERPSSLPTKQHSH
jgi:hypothetical protein